MLPLKAFATPYSTSGQKPCTRACMEGYKIILVNDVNTLSHTLLCPRQTLM